MIDLENPQFVYWKDGDLECHHVSDEYRHALLIDYAKKNNIEVFMETGTCDGNTAEALRHYVKRVFTIELSDYFFKKSQNRFWDIDNVMVSHGRSEDLLPSTLYLAKSLHAGKFLFWLDAHFSGGKTAGGIHPIREELTAIFESGVDGVILIDDLQDFWQNGLPELTRQVVSEYPEWQCEIKFGIGRITRRNNA